MENPGDGLALIGQIAKLQLCRGDALVIKTQGKLSIRQYEGLRVQMDHFLGSIGLTLSTMPVLILDEGMELQVLDTRELQDSKSKLKSGEAESV